MNTEEVDAVLGQLTARHGADLLRRHIDEVVNPAETVATILEKSGELLDPLVVRMLECAQQAWGEQRVLDDAIRDYGDPTLFRQSLGWRCLVVRMDQARRLARIAGDKKRSSQARKRAVAELKKRGMA